VSSRGSGCTRGRSLGAPQAIAIHPWSSTLYVATDYEGIAVFRRDPANGVLTQLDGLDGCVGNRPGCRSAKALERIYDVVMSPNGAFLYGASFQGVTTFQVTNKGALVPAAFPCVGDASLGCQEGFPAQRLAVSPDGRHLYAAWRWRDEVSLVAAYRTAGVLGLIRVEGPHGCVNWPHLRGVSCLYGFPYLSPSAVAVSPDGRHVYVTSALGDAVIVYVRVT
jgi:6-phosphogluconolactonase (cycloisomerase 2 family)